MRRFVFALLLVGTASAMAAPRPFIKEFSPSTIQMGSGERYLGITGGNFTSGEHGPVVIFDGPAGHFELTPSSITGFEPDVRLQTWVPTEIIYRAGRYSVVVRNAVNGDSDRVYFDVLGDSHIDIQVPPYVNVEATSPAGAVATYQASATSTTREPVSLTCAPASGSTFPLGVTYVRCDAAMADGSSRTTNFPVTVYDRTPPVLTLPGNMTVAAGNNEGKEVPFTATATDVADAHVPVQCSPASGSVFPIGTTEVHCSARDDSSNVASGHFLITVESSQHPVLTLPADFTVAGSSSAGAVVTFTATAKDWQGTVIRAWCMPETGSTFPIGTTVVMCNATDDWNRTSNGTFRVTVTPPSGKPPVLTLPGNFTVEAAYGTQGAEVTFTATAQDDVDGNVPVNCTPHSGATFPIGVTTVHCSATDSQNLTAHGSFDVTVTAYVDKPPVLSLPDDIIAYATNGQQGANVSFTATARDDVDGPVTIYCSPASGYFFPLGTSTVMCSASDSQSRTSMGMFNVTVLAGTNNPPVLTLPDDITVTAPTPQGATVTFTVTARDDHDGDVPVSCGPSSGATFPVGTFTVTCIATDSQKLSTTGTFQVTVLSPNDPPMLHLPADITVEATSSAGASVTYEALAFDDHDGAIPISCTPASGSTFPIGTTTVTCSAKDSRNLTTTGTFTVTITDPPDTAPALSLPDGITVEATSPEGTPVTFTALADDAVDGVLPVTCSPASGSPFALGMTTVTCSATNSRGLTTTGTFQVNVIDRTGPTIISLTASPNNLWPVNKRLIDITVTVQAQDGGDALPTARIIAITVNENVPTSDWTITGDLTARLRADRNGQEKPRIYTLVVEVTDASGNVSTATVDVVVPHDAADKGSAPTTRRRSVRH